MRIAPTALSSPSHAALCCLKKSKCKNIGALRNFKKFGCTRKGYGINDVFFANLATLGTGNSDEYGDLVLH